MIASAWAIWATRRLCSWMFSGYVLCMSPQRRMNFMRDRYAKKWLVAMDAARRRSDPKLRVQGVAEPVAEQVDAERGERQRRAGKRREPPRDVEEVAALRQHAAPRRRRRLDAEPEKADRRFGDDERRELQARQHNDGWRDVGEDVTEEQSPTTHAERRRRQNVVALLDRENLAAHDASIHDPPGRRKAQDRVAQTETDDGVDRHRQQDERKRELHFGDAHEHRRGPALDESRDEAEQSTEDRGEDHRAHADEERESRAVQDAREEITAELIGAEGMTGGAGRLQALREVGAQRIVRRQPRGRQRHDDRRHREPHTKPLLHRSRTRGSSQPYRRSTARL